MFRTFLNAIYCLFVFSLSLLSFSTSADAKKYDRVRVVNYSNDDIAYLLQINPGCGYARKGFAFVCHFRSTLKKGKHDDYKFNDGIEVAKWAQVVGIVAASVGAGPVGAVSMALAVQGFKEVTKAANKLPPNVVIMTIFPKNKVGKNKNQVRCVVPPGKSTIFIGPPKKGANGKINRFTCSFAPPSVIFAGKIVNMNKQKKEKICLTYNFSKTASKKRLKMEKCRTREDQVWFLFEDGTLSNAAEDKYKNCYGADRNGSDSWFTCGKRGRAENDFQRWAWTAKGRLQNEGLSKANERLYCLQPQDLRVVHNLDVGLRPCARGNDNPGAERWFPNGQVGNITKDFLALNSAGTDTLRQDGVYYSKPVHIHNASGKNINFLLQYRPGCGQSKAGFNFVCHYRKKIKNREGNVYKPPIAGFIAAEFAQEAGMAFATAGAGGAGAAQGLSKAQKLAKLGEKLLTSAVINSPKVASVYFANKASPHGVMILRVFPSKSAVKPGNNHAVCQVPITTETINILPHLPNATGKGDRFQCVLGDLSKILPAVWKHRPGKAIDIGAASEIWVIGNQKESKSGNKIYRWHRQKKRWEKIKGALTRIDVGPHGAPWGVNKKGSIFYRDLKKRKWRSVGGKANDIGVGANGKVWIIGKNNLRGGYDIYRRDRSSWVRMPGAATRIDVDPAGNAWVVKDNDDVFHFESNKWVYNKAAGKAIDVGVGSDGTVVILGKDGVPRVQQKDGKWKAIGGQGLNITVDKYGNAWMVNANKDIFSMNVRR